MRHRKKGRKLGRNPKHQRALLKNLVSALFLTEGEFDETDGNVPKVKGRIVTTLPKAKEVRPLVEKCVTLARRTLSNQEAADKLETTAERGTEKWREWRNGPKWQEWNQAIAPVVAARRRVIQLIGDKEAVKILFSEIAPRFADRDGGYTRILKLAKVRLGDAGKQAILEFVGKNDRVRTASVKPTFEDEPVADEAPAAVEEEVVEETTTEEKDA